METTGHTSDLGRIDSRYELGEHLFSTRSADFYAATDSLASGPFIVGALRHGLEAGSEAGRSFLSRMQKIAALEGFSPQVRNFGIDSNHKAFAVFPHEDYKPILEANATQERKLVLFRKAIELVGRLHSESVVVGDIASRSFMVDPNGNVHLLALLGTFEAEASSTSLLPTAETLFYIAPEQRSAGGSLPTSDVYAMGVLGYRFLTSRFPTGDTPPGSGEDVLKLGPAPTTVHSKLPEWMDEVLGKSLEFSGERRWKDCREFHDVYKEALGGGKSPARSSRWAQKTVMVHPELGGEQKQDPKPRSENSSSRQQVFEASPETEAQHASRSPLLIVGGLIAVAVLALVVLLFSGSRPDSPLQEEISIHTQYAPEELRIHLQQVVAADADFDTRLEALEKIAESNDPIAFAVLTSAMKQAPDPEFRRAAQDVIVKRIRNRGFPQTSRVVKKWFQLFNQSGQDPTLSPAYGLLLRACDTSVPLSARRKALEKAYEREPEIAMLVSAALALDEKEDVFVPVLKSFLAQVAPIGEIPGKGVAGLLLSHKPLWLFFESDIRQFFPSFSSRELAWGLLKLADSDSELLIDLAKETLRRKIVPPFQAEFLRVLVETDRFSLPAGIRKSLIRGARGELVELDVFTVGRWLDVASERVLFAMCAIAKEKDVALSAFETLAARSLHEEPARSLMEWVKNERWEYRSKLYRPIATLALHDIASPEQVRYGFDSLMPYSTGEGFLEVMLKVEDTGLLVQVIERFAEITSSPALLDLLSHEDKEVRIVSIKALKGRNELNVLQNVFRAYQRETDPQVKEIYEEHHWVTRDRKADPGTVKAVEEEA